MPRLPLFLWFLFLVLCSPLQAQEATPLKVGFIASLSGVAQPYGQAAKNGFEMGLEKVGRQNFQVIYEDDQFLSAKTVTAFLKLTDVDKVDLIINIGSSPASAIAPLAERKGIPLIAWASDTRVSKGRNMVIRSYPSGEKEGHLATDEALRRNLKRIAVLISNNAYAESWREGVLNAINPEKPVIDEEISTPTNDYRALAARISHLNIDAIGNCLDPGQNALMGRQIRDLGSNIPIFGCEYYSDAAEIAAAKGAFNGAWYSGVPITGWFLDEYVHRFGKASVISAAANHYDLALLLGRLDKGTKGPALAHNLLKLGPIEGAVGKFEVKEADGDRFFDVPLELRHVR